MLLSDESDRGSNSFSDTVICEKVEILVACDMWEIFEIFVSYDIFKWLMFVNKFLSELLLI